MMDWNALYSNEQPPSLEQVTEYINNPLWIDFNDRIQSAYRTRPCMEHSRCYMQAGWNIKYKKGGKFYLAMYELVFEDEPATAEQIIPIHNNAIYVDDRYLITEDEKQHIIKTFFSTTHPLVLKSFSSKEKKKVVILGKIAEQFEYGKKYSEQEVNEILRPIYEDYMTIRRYLIMYGFMERTKDGRQYWLTN